MTKHIDIALLRSLAATGSYRAEIGKRLGVHSTTAARQARKHGIVIRVAPGPHDDRAEWWVGRIDQALAMKAENISFSDIARRLGTTKNAVVGKFDRLGKCKAGGTTRDSTFWKRNTAELLRLHAEGWPDRRIAKHLGIPHGTVHSRLVTLRKREAKAPHPQIEFPPFGHCVMPSGDMPNMTFCGAEVEDITKPYCDAHIRVAYLPPKPADMRIVA